MNKSKLSLFFILFCFVFLSQSENLISKEVLLKDWSLESSGKQPLFSLVPWQKLSQRSFQKVPLILIHGTLSEFKKFSNWSFLLKEIKKKQKNSKKFLEKYEIFTFRYPSNTHNSKELVLKLAKSLKELEALYQKNSTLEDFKKLKYKFVVSSLGGNILCEVFSGKHFETGKVLQIISIGTPFWGIPLLNEELLNQVSLSKEEKISNFLLLKGTYSLYPVLKDFLQWKLAFYQGAEAPSLKQTRKYLKIYQEHGCFTVREKITSYGSFLESPYNNSNLGKKGEEWLKENLVSFNYKHAWNSLMHYKMSKDLFTNFSLQYLLNFNDGLVPVYSSLFLDPLEFGWAFQEKSIEFLLKKIRSPNYRYKSRLFFNLDHTDLTFEHKNLKIKDLITGQEKESIARFILEDLEF